MIVDLRRTALFFTLSSAVYWALVARLWASVTPRYFEYWIVLVSSTLPPMLYALGALWFFRRLTRQIAKQVVKQQNSDASDV